MGEINRFFDARRVGEQISFHFKILSVALKTRFVEVNHAVAITREKGSTSTFLYCSIDDVSLRKLQQAKF